MALKRGILLEEDLGVVGDGRIYQNGVQVAGPVRGTGNDIGETQRQTIAKDINAGKILGNRYVPDESLGRLSQDQGIQASISRLQDLSQGLTARETEARREQAFKNIDAQGASQQRALQAALARAGVKGGVAGKQLTQQSIGTLQQKANVERDLFLQDRDARVQGLNTLLQAQSGVSQFDLAQQAKEKLAQLQTGLTFGALGAAERGANLAANAQIRSANTAASGGSSGGLLTNIFSSVTIVCTELHRQGLIPTEVYKANVKFGDALSKIEPYTFKGYLLWGKPVANIMRRSKIATFILAPIMKKWIYGIYSDKSMLNTTAIKTAVSVSRGLGYLLKLKDMLTPKFLRG